MVGLSDVILVSRARRHVAQSEAIKTGDHVRTSQKLLKSLEVKTPFFALKFFIIQIGESVYSRIMYMCQMLAV